MQHPVKLSLFFYCVAERAVKPCGSSRSNSRGGMTKSHDTCKTGSKHKNPSNKSNNNNHIQSSFRQSLQVQSDSNIQSSFRQSLQVQSIVRTDSLHVKQISFDGPTGGGSQWSPRDPPPISQTWFATTSTFLLHLQLECSTKLLSTSKWKHRCNLSTQ